MGLPFRLPSDRVATAWSQMTSLVTVISKPISRIIELPGELQLFKASLHAKVHGYVERVLVDRGSLVKRGQILAQLSAPEMSAQIAESEAKSRPQNRTARRQMHNWLPHKVLMIA